MGDAVLMPRTVLTTAALTTPTRMHAQAAIPKMIAMCTRQKKSIDAAVAFAERELESFTRS